MLNKDERMENEIASESEVKILHLREALTMAFGAILMMFMLYTSATSPLSPLLQRSLTLLLVVYIAVLVKPMKGGYALRLTPLSLSGLLLAWDMSYATGRRWLTERLMNRLCLRSFLGSYWW